MNAFGSLNTMDVSDNRALRFIARIQCDWWLPFQAIINRLFEDGLIDDDEFVRTQALEFLKKNADKFNPMKRMEIKSKIVEKLDSYGKEYLTRQTFESEYANFEEPSDSNGFTVLNIDKIEAMISYLAEKVSNLFKVKLMKMLWYSDVLSFIENGFAMTGIVYRHEPMGALPIGHYSLMNFENLNIKEEMSYNYDTMLHVYPTVGMDYSILK